MVPAGRTVAMQLEASGVAVRWRPRGGAEERRTVADGVVNCTGPD
jgi:uncharacterized NAD(P)/FAD-binding protein YdhS